MTTDTDTIEAIEQAEREYLAHQAWYELGGIFKLLPKIDSDEPETLRGLAIRCDALTDVMYNGLRRDEPVDLDILRQTIFGYNAEDARAGFAGWMERRREDAAREAASDPAPAD